MYGSFPPAYIADSAGKPAHSWRVLILPFMDRPELYEQYNFDEPWNGPNNRKLASQMPGLFACPSDSNKPPEMTSYVAVLGPETIWPGSGTPSFEDVQDDPSQTLLLVEFANSDIHWMEPRDLILDAIIAEANDRPCLSSAHPDRVNVAFVNHRHISIPKSETTADKLRALLTIDGGEETPDF
jgi:hypothetical protein